ncbi:MAG: mechanosensitive ion channel [Gammaproteobacteria bacterium]|nr:mechanosensitive ion channel [Gammaproteobacteria bacterium]
MDWILEFEWGQLIAPTVTIIIGIVLYKLLQSFFKAREKSSDSAILQKQITSFIFMLIFVIAFVLALPIKDSLQGQIIGLIGILLSASIALSSTTFLGNLMAGIWLRSVKNFRVGDLIEIGDNFGRVTTRGLFHIEVQNRERDLITLPNLHLVTNPVTVMHNNGTIISTEVSLGYDVDHSVIEPILIQAVEAAGLENPFVYIESLGDFSIVYKVHGLVKEINTLLSARSNLNAHVLDALHKANVEIVSPSFMNQRQVNEDIFIPKQKGKKGRLKVAPEEVIFDKADRAEKLDDLRKKAQELEGEIQQLKLDIKEESDTDKKQQLQEQLDKLVDKQERIHQYVKEKSKEVSKEGKDD